MNIYIFDEVIHVPTISNPTNVAALGRRVLPLEQNPRFLSRSQVTVKPEKRLEVGLRELDELLQSC